MTNHVEMDYSLGAIIYYLLFTGLAALAGWLAIYEIAYKKLRIRYEKDMTSSYLDLRDNTYEENYRFKIINERSMFDNTNLPKKINKESEMIVCYKPAISYRQKLDPNYYNIKMNSGNKQIQLSVKQIHQFEMEEIYLNIKTVLKNVRITEIQNNISVKFESNKIIVSNDNIEEIRFYSFEIKPTLTTDKFFVKNQKQIDSFTEKDNGETIILTIKTIPPKTNDPGKIELQI